MCNTRAALKGREYALRDTNELKSKGVKRLERAIAMFLDVVPSLGLTYFVKNNSENNLLSLDIMQSASNCRGLWETRQERSINHTMC